MLVHSGRAIGSIKETVDYICMLEYLLVELIFSATEVAEKVKTM
jgi:hypothetical protein